MSKIQSFLCNSGPDHKGRTLDQILTLDDASWDKCHDFIQWLFPLPVASKFFAGDDCPVLTLGDLSLGMGHSVVRENLKKSVDRYLKFLGLSGECWTDEVPHVYLSNKFSEQADYWLKANDHNHLRINRMLQCLVLFGLEDLAKIIFRALVMIKCEFDDCITGQTMIYWRNALTGYSY